MVDPIKEPLTWEELEQKLRDYLGYCKDPRNIEVAEFILGRLKSWMEFEYEGEKSYGKPNSKFMKHFMAKEPFCKTKRSKLFKNYPCFTVRLTRKRES
mmetsp:Transcript_31369/g.28559  ORF Transcript_31369/g.28559 Transcript_31369/m.28559 type:complete len:98 (+) Transcript_31369:329-622(+)